MLNRDCSWKMKDGYGVIEECELNDLMKDEMKWGWMRWYV